MWLVRVAGPPPGCGWSHVPHSRIKFPGQVPVCTGCTGCSAQGVQGVHIVYRVFILQGCTTCRGFPSLSTGVQHCLGCTCHCTALYCTVLYGVVTRPGYDHCSMNGPRYAACSLQHCSTLTVSLCLQLWSRLGHPEQRGDAPVPLHPAAGPGGGGGGGGALLRHLLQLPVVAHKPCNMANMSIWCH